MDVIEVLGVPEDNEAEDAEPEATEPVVRLNESDIGCGVPDAAEPVFELIEADFAELPGRPDGAGPNQVEPERDSETAAVRVGI